MKPACYGPLVAQLTIHSRFSMLLHYRIMSGPLEHRNLIFTALSPNWCCCEEITKSVMLGLSRRNNRTRHYSHYEQPSILGAIKPSPFRRPVSKQGAWPWHEPGTALADIPIAFRDKYLQFRLRYMCPGHEICQALSLLSIYLQKLDVDACPRCRSSWCLFCGRAANRNSGPHHCS